MINKRKTKSPIPIRRQRLASPWIYFALTLGWSWLFLTPAIILNMRGDEPLTIVLRVLSGIAPFGVALVLLYLTQGREGRRDYWLRVVDVRRISPRWWAVILLLQPAIMAIAAFLDTLLGEAELN